MRLKSEHVKIIEICKTCLIVLKDKKKKKKSLECKQAVMQKPPINAEKAVLLTDHPTD